MKKEQKAEVYLVNRQRRLKLDENRILRTIERLLEKSGAGLSILGVILLGDRAMSRYNREFAGHTGTTDVLSFPLDPGEGEIIISVETAERQAAGLGHGTEHEIAVLAAHGILHLAGYDDAQPAERRLMEERTERLLLEAGVGPAGKAKKTRPVTPGMKRIPEK